MTATIALPRQPHSEFLARLRTVQLALGGRGVMGLGLGRSSVQAAAGNGLLNNLVAYWSLEEASNTRYDAHSSYDLTAYGTVPSTSGKIGNCVDFTPYSPSNYLFRSKIAFGDSDFTIAAWTYAASTSDSFTQSVIANGDINASAIGGYHLGTWSAPRMAFNVGNGSTNGLVISDINTILLNTWELWIGWYDSVNDTVNLQKNASGIIWQKSHAGGEAGSGAPYAQTRIGTNANVIRKWNGYLDEIGIWSAVLTADQRTALYNSGAGLAYAQFTT